MTCPWLRSRLSATRRIDARRRDHRPAHRLPREDELEERLLRVALHEVHDERRVGQFLVLVESELHDELEFAALQLVGDEHARAGRGDPVHDSRERTPRRDVIPSHGKPDDHQRVREAARDVGQYSVTACLPVDVMGVYVLLPDSL